MEMSNVKCAICGESLVNGHPYKAHGIKLENYIYKHHPRINLLTGKQIIWKNNLESYFLSDFDTKIELNKWLKTQTIKKQQEYLKKILLKRKEIKGINKALSQFESRALMMPAVSYYNKIFNNEYHELCQEIGLISRFDYNQVLEFDNKRKYKICIDSREITPLNFKREVLIQTISVGDYRSEPMFQNFHVERKTISDWAGTMSKGYDRFCRELDKAKELGIYIVMIIESKYSDLISINYLPHTRRIQASSEFLLKRCRDLFVNYDNFQTCAVDGRIESVNLIEKLFKMKNKIETVDIQYNIDINNI